MRLAVLLLTLFAGPAPGAAQGRELHGADSMFAGHGVALAWGVLRTAVEAETQVVIRISIVDRAYAYVSVDSVDPFTQARQPVVQSRAILDALDVRSLRTTFGDFPRREIRLYRTAGHWHAGDPALTVYYLGVPDTTPEFTSDAALLAYLTATVAKLRAAAAGRTP